MKIDSFPPKTRAEARRYIVRMIYGDTPSGSPVESIKRAERRAKESGRLTRGVDADMEYWRWAIFYYQKLQYKNWMGDEVSVLRLKGKVPGFQVDGHVIAKLSNEELEDYYLKKERENFNNNRNMKPKK